MRCRTSCTQMAIVAVQMGPLPFMAAVADILGLLHNLAAVADVNNLWNGTINNS